MPLRICLVIHQVDDCVQVAVNQYTSHPNIGFRAAGCALISIVLVYCIAEFSL